MNPLLLTAWLACQAFDASSTIVALRNPQLTEGNPIMRTAGVPIRVSINVLALMAYRKHAKGNAAVRAIPYVLATTGCAAGVLNVHTMGKVGK